MTRDFSVLTLLARFVARRRRRGRGEYGEVVFDQEATILIRDSFRCSNRRGGNFCRRWCEASLRLPSQ